MEVRNFIDQFKQRRLGVLVDDASAQPRGILIAAAQDITESTVNELMSLTVSVLFVGISSERQGRLMLSSMERPKTTAPDAPSNFEPYRNMLISVEAREGVSTGISMADRATTVRYLGAAEPRAESLVSPGHIFPVRVRTGGVLVKHALPEGAVDLVRLAGFSDAAAFADLLDERGELMDRLQLRKLAKVQQLPITYLSDVVRYRLENERLVERVAEAVVPTHVAGDLQAIVYRVKHYEGDHLALIKGKLNPQEPVLVRVQSEFTLADVFGGSTPPTRGQIYGSLAEINQVGSGVLIYLRSSEAGQLSEQIAQWNNSFSRNPAAMLREYGIGAQILHDLGVSKITLLSSAPRKLVGLKAFGIEVVGQRHLTPSPQREASSISDDFKRF